MSPRGGKPLGHGRGGEGSVDVRSAVCLLERDWRKKSVKGEEEEEEEECIETKKGGR